MNPVAVLSHVETTRRDARAVFQKKKPKFGTYRSPIGGSYGNFESIYHALGAGIRFESISGEIEFLFASFCTFEDVRRKIDGSLKVAPFFEL